MRRPAERYNLISGRWRTAEKRFRNKELEKPLGFRGIRSDLTFLAVEVRRQARHSHVIDIKQKVLQMNQFSGVKDSRGSGRQGSRVRGFK